MRILVTGGAGFIASEIAAAYIDRGHEVTVVDSLVRGNRERVPAGASFCQVDINDPDLEAVFATASFDVVSHHAAHVSVRESLDDLEFDARSNIQGTLSVLRLATQYGVKKFIYAGTVAAYGEPVALPVTEDHPMRPMNPYGISKSAAEQYISFYGLAKGLQCVKFRYANVYGPHADTQGEAGVVTIFADLMVKGKRPTIFGDGEQTRDFVFVGDVVRANIAALDYPQSDCFNISTNTEITVNELYATMARLIGYGGKPSYEQAKAGEVLRIYLDNSKARSLLHWEPTTSLEEGLAQVAANFAKRAEIGQGR
ncbi:MAG: NAD-dependent epimerase/dehydratase family protein [Dehalococcoidia bacterium]|nr:NAD-dependent epimerase/dehydratase family protein [Dehalococcoidia bacterium]